MDLDSAWLVVRMLKSRSWAISELRKPPSTFLLLGIKDVL